MRVTPSLPSFVGFFINLLRPSYYFGIPGRRGQKHDILEPQKSDCLSLFRVSTKPMIKKNG
jgi:hypothetical protein